MCSVFSVIDGAALRIDDKLRVAKERREEQEKQHGDKAKNFTQQVLATLDVHVTIVLQKDNNWYTGDKRKRNNT